jgi:hypothetical protein
MKLEEIKAFLRERPGYLKKGAGSLAVHLGANLNKCKKALKEVRNELRYPKEKDVEENLVLRSRWFNGKEWCESYRNVNIDPHPLTPEDWKEIITEIGPVKSLVSIEDPDYANKTLVIWTSDKHIGAHIPSDALYKKQYNEHVFHERMAKIVEEVQKLTHLHGQFEHVIIADLGDSLDGYNKRTTRGGHELPQNLNNKEAARVHFFTHKWFYDSLIRSNVAKEITVLNVSNDNHAGDFGWQANFGLQQYGELAWPNIKFINQEEFLGHITVYDRALITTHGKDKKNRFKGLPLKVNADVEAFVFDYVHDRKLNAYNIHVRKGDIHLNDLDSSRLKMSYWNIGSVFGSSDWIMDNFSFTRPSCVLEIIEEGSDNLDGKIVWLD